MQGDERVRRRIDEYVAKNVIEKARRSQSVQPGMGLEEFACTTQHVLKKTTSAKNANEEALPPATAASFRDEGKRSSRRHHPKLWRMHNRERPHLDCRDDCSHACSLRASLFRSRDPAHQPSACKSTQID